jgi:hypothetical protein
MRTPKCQSKKHNTSYGCSSPRCPEGLYVKKVIGDAIKNHDVTAYLKARDLQNAATRVVHIQNGIATVGVRDDKGQNVIVSAPIDREEIRQALRDIDKTDVPSFETLDDLGAHVESLYSPYLKLSLHYEESKYGWKHVYVQDMSADADLRSTGMGRHVRNMLAKYCDEKSILLFGTPTDAGDRSYDRDFDTRVTKEEHVQKAIAHRERLKNYYLKTGYEKNEGFRYSFPKDHLTGEVREVNHEWREKFNMQALGYLGEAGEYVRWPKSGIPKSMISKRAPRVVQDNFEDYVDVR